MNTGFLGFSILMALGGAALTACETKAAPSAPTPALGVPAMPASVARAAPADAAGAHFLRYDLVLAVSGGAGASTRSTFSVDVSDASPGSVTFAKNVVVSGSSRADVGSNVKARVTMEGATPRLELEAEISGVDASGKIYRMSPRGAASTPLETPTVVIDSDEGGSKLRVTATPVATTAPSTRETNKPAAPVTPPWTLDVVVVEGPTTSPTKISPLHLVLTNDAPVVVNKSESVPLSTAGSGASARQTVGSRVKASARPHGAGLEIDFDLEVSAVEPSTSGTRVRKIRAHGPVLATFDTPAIAFVGEDDGARYEVRVTAKRGE